MLKIIADAYKLFLRNFPVILLYAMPLLVLDTMDTFFFRRINDNKEVGYFFILSVYLIPLVSSGVDIALYKRLFGMKSVNPLASLKVFFSYFFVQFGIGLIAVAPLYAIYYILNRNSGPTLSHLITSLSLNMFIGTYFLARFNLVLPLIVKNKILNLKDFLKFSNDKYSNWLLVGFLIYAPYIVLTYTISNPYANLVLTDLFMLVFVCFNTSYILNRKIPTAIKVEKIKELSKEKKTSAPKASPKKTAAKAPKMEAKTKTPKTEAKTKTSAKTKKEASKKSASSKKPAKAPKLKPVTA